MSRITEWQILSRQASWLSKYPAVRISVEGHCDERGTREYNLALGARRANSVKEFLVSQGVSTARVETVSYGKSAWSAPRPTRRAGPRTAAVSPPLPAARIRNLRLLEEGAWDHSYAPFLL